MTVTAILLAGGAGARLQQPTNKVYVPVGQRPLLRWSLTALLSSPLVDEAVLVIRDRDAGEAEHAVSDELAPRVRAVVSGGATRHDSEQAGLEAVAPGIEAGEVEVVLIHDAARPFPSPALVGRTVDAARRVGGAVPVLALDATVVRVDGGHVGGDLAGDHIRRVQTPQAFTAAPLLAAYRAAAADGFRGSDTAESVLAYSSLEVAGIEGEADNVKVTYADDLAYAQQVAARRPSA